MSEIALGLPYDGNAEGMIAFKGRLLRLIVESAKKFGEKPVVIIDEYDAPLLNVLHLPSELEKVRQLMRTVYSPLKDCDRYLRFVFISGITKFSQLSIFSELNNLENISMLPEYSSLCGITQLEIETTFSEGVDDLARKMGVGRDEVLEKLRVNYDGYHFSKQGEGVYNPFSLLKALMLKKVDSYWFASGTPTYLVEMINRFDTDITKIDGNTARASAFDAPTEAMESILPLFYQSGYITIKGYDPQFELYTLGFPNKEVRLGLLEALFPYYASRRPYDYSRAADICRRIFAGDVEGMLEYIRSFLKSIPYEEDTRQSEGHYRQMLYLFFALLGQYVPQAEVRTSDGRVDILLANKDYVYVMECKLNGSADEALKQIDDKGYSIAWQADGRKVAKVGINFSTQTGTIEEWVVG